MEQQQRLVAAEERLGLLDSDASLPAHHLLQRQWQVQDLPGNLLVHADRDLAGGGQLAALGLGQQLLQVDELPFESGLHDLGPHVVGRLADPAGGAASDEHERQDHWMTVAEQDAGIVYHQVAAGQAGPLTWGPRRAYRTPHVEACTARNAPRAVLCASVLVAFWAGAVPGAPSDDTDVLVPYAGREIVAIDLSGYETTREEVIRREIRSAV